MSEPIYLGAAKCVRLRWEPGMRRVYVWAFVRDRLGGGSFFRTGALDA